MTMVAVGKPKGTNTYRAETRGTPLTEIDLITLYWLATGASSEEIARACQLASVYTAKTRLKALYARLGADNAPHAVFLAIQQGWLDPVTGKTNAKPVKPISGEAIRVAVRESFDAAVQKVVADDQAAVRATAQEMVADLLRETGSGS